MSNFIIFFNMKKLYQLISLGIFIFAIFSGLANATAICDHQDMTVSKAECEALVDLYNSTNGPGWANSTNWLTSPDVETWHGVTDAGGHVTDVNLYNNDLV